MRPSTRRALITLLLGCCAAVLIGPLVFVLGPIFYAPAAALVAVLITWFVSRAAGRRAN